MRGLALPAAPKAPRGTAIDRLVAVGVVGGFGAACDLGTTAVVCLAVAAAGWASLARGSRLRWIVLGALLLVVHRMQVSSHMRDLDRYHGRTCGCFAELASAAGRLGEWRRPLLPDSYFELGATCDRDDGVYCDEESIPYCWVGGGLDPAVTSKHRALLMFCPTANPGARSHIHYIEGGRSNSCGNNGTLIEKLRHAIELGETGRVPYREESMRILRHELAQREDWEAEQPSSPR